MDPWELFSDLCRQVVEEQNVCLEVTIFGNCISMGLFPYTDDDFEDEEDE